MSESTQPAGLGEVLRGKYRVERVLGQGGMGVVLLAQDLRLGRPVAIKRLQADARPEWRIRFAREARAAAQLSSDTTVRIHDVDDTDPADPLLVMEFLDGQDLDRVLRGRGPLPISEAVDYLLQVCVGLGEAHALGIVHRDLKPANLFLVRAADGAMRVKILDFGISKRVTDDDALAVTERSTIVGSPSYMSPEQLRASSDVDARSDVWSLGIVLYQLLTNALPFVATNAASLAARIVANPPEPLLALRADVPTELEGTIIWCLDKDRQKRPQTVEALVERLAPFSPERAEQVRKIFSLRAGGRKLSTSNEAPLLSAQPDAVTAALTKDVSAATPPSGPAQLLPPPAVPGLAAPQTKIPRATLWPWVAVGVVTCFLIAALVLWNRQPRTASPAAVEATPTTSPPSTTSTKPNPTPSPALPHAPATRRRPGNAAPAPASTKNPLELDFK